MTSTTFKRIALLSIIGLSFHAGLLAKSQFPCRTWPSLASDDKVAIIQKVIDLSKANGTQLLLPATYYARELDQLVQTYVETDNQVALDSSLGVTFHTVAAMEGDWGNGQGKVAHAREWMGEWFETFKKRFPEKYAHLVKLDEEAETKKP